MEILPTDIVINILSRLPVKSLLRFKCVCKSWRTLINTSTFANLHLSNSLSSNSNRFLIVATLSNNLYSFDLDSPESPAIQLQIPQIFDPCVNDQVLKSKQVRLICDDKVIKFGGSCNGLVCLYNSYCGAALLNPCTQFYRIIPGIVGMWFDCLGLGFDFLNCDYKLVRTNGVNTMVYSLNDDSWKPCTSFRFDNGDEFYVDQDRCNSGVLIHNHLLHWIMFSRFLPDKAPAISCFNVCNEEWSVVPLPDSVIEKYNRYYILKLRVLDDCLCLFVLTNGVNPELGSYSVWIMKEYGVAKSWVELSGISDWVRNDERYYYCGFLPPIAFCKERREILLNQPDPWSDTARFYWLIYKRKQPEMRECRGYQNMLGWLCLGEVLLASLAACKLVKRTKMDRNRTGSVSRKDGASWGFGGVLKVTIT